jgi:AcrR family transcriptional regulator
MPFARFEKLEPEKRERLLDAAAREFAAYGYAGASINRILEAARFSKGAAYYYVADKADLFAATVAWCGEQITLLDGALDLTALTAGTYWPTFTRLRREPLLRSQQRPWLFGALKAVEQLDPTTLRDGPLADYVARFQAYVLGMLRRGQALGVVRADLPEELLLAWLQALDRSGDDWLLAHWDALTPDDIARLADHTSAAMRRAVTPDDHERA